MADNFSVKALLERKEIMLKAHNTETAEYKRLEPNKYQAQLVNIDRHSGPYGTSLKITFEIVQGNDCTKITSFVTPSLFVGNEKRQPSKLCQLFHAIEKRMPNPGEDIDLTSLRGKYCYITVSDMPGKKYQMIKDFQPLNVSSLGFQD